MAQWSPVQPFFVIMQHFSPSRGGALHDDKQNRCEGDYWHMNDKPLEAAPQEFLQSCSVSLSLLHILSLSLHDLAVNIMIIFINT